MPLDVIYESPMKIKTPMLPTLFGITNETVTGLPDCTLPLDAFTTEFVKLTAAGVTVSVKAAWAQFGLPVRLSPLNGW